MLRRFASLRKRVPRLSQAMTSGHTFIFSRRVSPELCQESSALDNIGRGECRVPSAPAASCAHGSGRCTRVFTASSPENARHPHAMVYGLWRALPGDRAFLPPSPADCSTDLTPASGCQDHTTSPSASISFARTLACADTVASTASRTPRP